MVVEVEGVVMAEVEEGDREVGVEEGDRVVGVGI